MYCAGFGRKKENVGGENRDEEDKGARAVKGAIYRADKTMERRSAAGPVCVTYGLRVCFRGKQCERLRDE